MAVNLDFVGNTQALIDSVGKATGSVVELNKETKEFDEVSKKSFTDGAKAVTTFDKAVEEVKIDPLKKQLNDLNKSVESGGLTFKQLSRTVKEYQTVAILAGKDSPVGKEALRRAGELKDELGDLNAQVNNLSQDGQKLQGALMLGSTIAAGYSAFQGVAALVGVENEKLQETFVKLQAAQSILMGIEQIRASLEKESQLRIQASILLDKIKSATTLGLAAATGTSTGAMKLFRLALIGTGIGAIIVGIGLLIANFDKVSSVVTTAVAKFRNMGAIMKVILFPITQLIWAYDMVMIALQKLGVIDSEETKKMKLNADARVIAAKSETDKRIEGIDWEISKRKAANEDTKALERDKQNVLIEGMTAEGKAIAESVKLNGELTKEQRERFEELKKGVKEAKQTLVINAIAEKTEEREKNKKLAEDRKKLAEERKKIAEKEAEDRKKLEQDLQAELDRLSKDAEKQSIENLTGKEKINALRDQALKEVDVLEQSIIAKGKLLDKEYKLTQEQQDQLNILRSGINVQAFNDRKKSDSDKLKATEEYAKKNMDLQEQIDIEEVNLIEDTTIKAEDLEAMKHEAVLNIQREYAQKRLDALKNSNDKESELEKLKLKSTISTLDKELGEIDKTKKKFSFAKAIGVTDKEFTAIKGVLKDVGNKVLSSIQDNIKEQIKANQDLITGIDGRIDATEEALDRELELNKQGFASNVDGKRAELEQLKKQREDALKQQEELQKKQLILDTAIQLSSMITAATNIYKTMSVIPIYGIPLAIAMIATMFGSFALAKVTAFQAIGQNSKLEKGGSGDSTGIIKGRRHSQGGENFLSNIEVEDGEQWSVFNRGATQKHGNFIHGITELINSGDNRLDMIDDLLFGTGIMRTDIDKKIDSNKNIIIHKERIIVANLTSEKMIEHLKSVDLGVAEIVKHNNNKVDRWEDSKFSYEKKGSVIKKIIKR